MANAPTAKFWESLLATTAEEIHLRLMEDCAEERYSAGWLSEALVHAEKHAPLDVSFLHGLLKSALKSLRGYALFLEQCIELIHQELAVRGKDSDPRLRESPQTELQTRVSGSIQEQMEFEGAPAEETPSLAKIDRETFSHEYAISQINEFLSRFNARASD